MVPAKFLSGAVAVRPDARTQSPHFIDKLLPAQSSEILIQRLTGIRNAHGTPQDKRGRQECGQNEGK